MTNDRNRQDGLKRITEERDNLPPGVPKVLIRSAPAFLNQQLLSSYAQDFFNTSKATRICLCPSGALRPPSCLSS